VRQSIYLIGSLRNPEVPLIAEKLRAEGYDVFDDWYAAGPEADDYWQKYEKAKGHNYAQALQGFAADHVYKFDRHHLERCDIAVLLLPAGKSGHLELGWALGRGKFGYILLSGEPERYDVMYKFADGIVNTYEELLERMKADAPRIESGRYSMGITPASFGLTCSTPFRSEGGSEDRGFRTEPKGNKEIP